MEKEREIRREVGLGRGGGQVVTVLVLYSDDPSSNPVDFYNFFL